MQILILFKESLSGLYDLLIKGTSNFRGLIIILVIFLSIHIFITFRPVFGYENSKGLLTGDIMVCTFFEFFILFLALVAGIIPYLNTYINNGASIESIELPTIVFGFLLQGVKVLVDGIKDCTEIT